MSQAELKQCVLKRLDVRSIAILISNNVCNGVDGKIESLEEVDSEILKQAVVVDYQAED